MKLISKLTKTHSTRIIKINHNDVFYIWLFLLKKWIYVKPVINCKINYIIWLKFYEILQKTTIVRQNNIKR